MKPTNTKNINGFTLVELLTTICIIGIAAAITIPSLVGLINKNTKDAGREELISALNLARSSAITAGSWATICGSNASNTQCSSSKSNWNNGWIVFMDANRNGLIEPAEKIVSTRESMAGSLSVNTSLSHITFDNQGLADGYKTTFLFCSSSESNDKLIAIKVSNFGRFREARDDDQVTGCNA